MAAGTVASPDWLKQYGATGTATGAGGAGGAGQDRSNINWLLNPYVALPETQMQGAEGAVAGGFSGSGFAGARTNKLLDSERIARMKLGHELLEPYLQREFQGAQNEADRQARLNQIAAEGAQALQRLQLSEAGQTQRLDKETQAALERQILSGQQALQQLQLQEAGQTSRLNTSIRGNIANTLIGANLNRTGAGRTGTNNVATGMGGTTTPNYVTTFDWASQLPSTRTTSTPNAGTSRITSATIDNVLRRYGIL